MNTMTQDSSTGLWNNKNRKIFFWSILALAVILRCIRFATVPDGINQDEAMGAVDAWALSKYGTDRYGTFLPVHFTAWRYSQMSVLLAYCMVPFIKLFGFNTVTVRLPMVLISSGAVALVYLVGRKLFSERIALVAMLLTAVNPWQFMQSRWSLDCNLFPHIFLLGFYLLLLGLEKRRYLYLSMGFFGLTFYCYGIAAYSVTAFLFVFFIWCLWKRRLKFREGLLCALIFTVVALPEVIVLGINAVHFDRTISTPLFTMPYFPDSVRSADILLLNFSFAQLGKMPGLCSAMYSCSCRIFSSIRFRLLARCIMCRSRLSLWGSLYLPYSSSGRKILKNRHRCWHYGASWSPGSGSA